MQPSSDGPGDEALEGGLLLERPPGDAVPGMSELALVLYSGPEVLVGVHGFRVWPGGMLFVLSVHQRTVRGIPERRLWLEQYGESIGQPLFELGVRFADGRQVWSAQGYGRFGGPAGSAQQGVLLQLRGGGGRAEDFNLDCWLAPVPASGLVGFGCRWSVGGIEETWQYTDAATLRAAAERTIPAPWARTAP
ncbi:hypothetical protein [Ornithinimicrobium pratense]|uniref:Uncharacterized protein n=1 Tax=Ornithinimicrobium pratense TaxID=2593973 RepID=A0A5J6V391_9MICO|nr:hypothetical protein [Ornithinimicrobium pratense]QFG68400.1 hypothetical protein FY030_06445 [Ornithinimicrobium pratense]